MSDNYSGTYKAVVVRNKDPKAQARVTLRIPQILGSAESAWASPASPAQRVPDVGEFVYATFDGGDISAPIYSAVSGTAKTPKQPTSLALSSAAYATNEGLVMATVTAQWVVPTENQDGSTPVDLSGFRASFSYDGTVWSGGQFTADPKITFNTITAGKTVYVRVSSVNHDNTQSLYTQGTLTSATMATPPGTVLGSVSDKTQMFFGGSVPTSKAVGDLWVNNTTGMPLGDTTNQIMESLPGVVANTTVWTDGNGVKWTTRVSNSQTFLFKSLNGPILFKAGDTVRVTYTAYTTAASNSATVRFRGGDGLAASSFNLTAQGATSITSTPTSFVYEGVVPANTIGTNTQYSVGLASSAGNDVWVRDVTITKTVATNLTHVAKSVGANQIISGEWEETTDGRVQTALDSANGKTKNTYSQSDASGTGTTIGDTWFKVDINNVVIGQWKWDGTGWLPQTIGSAVIANLDVGRLVTGSIAAGQKIIAGPATGHHAEMSSTGFTVYSVNPEDNSVYPSTQLGTSAADSVSVYDANGVKTAGISDDGTVTGLKASLTGDGTNRGVEIYGRDFIDWAKERSVVVTAGSVSNAVVSNITARVGMYEIAFQADSSRTYRLHAQSPHVHCTTANAMALLSLRYTSDGSTPTANSPLLESTIVVSPNTNRYATPPAFDIAGTFGSGLIRVLMCIEAYEPTTGVWDVSAFSGDAKFVKPVRMWVEDIGPTPDESTLVANNGGGTVTPVKKQYTTEWLANLTEGFGLNGAGGTTFTPRTDITDLGHGQYSTYHGNQFGLAIFDTTATGGDQVGTALATALSGATIKSAYVELYFNHWDGSSGTASIRTNTLTAIPASTTAPTGTVVTSANWPDPGKRAVNITSIFTAATRGVWVGATGSTSRSLYGRVAGTGVLRPKLIVTYVK